MIHKQFETSCQQSHAKMLFNVFAVSTGQTDSGIDLGSPGFVPLETPQIALLIGKGTDVYNAGEVWHLLDQRYNMAVSLIDASHVRDIDLNRYNTVIAAGGSYSNLDSTGVNALKQWLRQGNTLIALNSAVRWAIDSKLASAQYIKRSRENPGERKAIYQCTQRPGRADYWRCYLSSSPGSHPSPRLWVSQR